MDSGAEDKRAASTTAGDPGRPGDASQAVGKRGGLSRVSILWMVSLAASCLAYALLWLGWKETQTRLVAAILPIAGGVAVLAIACMLGLLWTRETKRSKASALLLVAGPLGWLILWSLPTEDERREFALTKNAGAVVFLSRHQASPDTHASMPDLKVEKLSGLLFCEIIEDSTASSVLAYWRQKSDFEAGIQVLKRQLSLGELLDGHYVRGTAHPRRRLWKRVTPYALVIHAVAFLGGVAALERHYAWLLEPPLLHPVLRPAVDLGGAHRQDQMPVLEGRTAEVELVVWNHSRTEVVEITGLDLLLDDQPSDAKREIPAPIGPKEKGSTVIDLRRLPIGTHTLRASVVGKAGRLIRPRAFDTTTFTIRVFSENPVVTASYSTGSESALFVGTVSVGAAAPRGLICQITASAPDVRFEGLRFPGVKENPPSESSPNGRTHSQTFTTPALEGLQDYDFQFYLGGPPGTDWRAVQLRLPRCSLL